MIIEFEGKHYCITSDCDKIKILLKATKSEDKHELLRVSRAVNYSIDGVLDLPWYEPTGETKWVIDIDSYEPMEIEMMIMHKPGGVSTDGCYLHRREIHWCMGKPFDFRTEAMASIKTMVHKRLDEIKDAKKIWSSEKALLERILKEK